MKNSAKIIPCIGCEETCDRIETILRAYLRMMSWEETKTDAWAFWRTLCAFMRRENEIAVLEHIYDTSMRDTNKALISKKDFVAYMARSTK
jgi:hypothetical protein